AVRNVSDSDPAISEENATPEVTRVLANFIARAEIGGVAVRGCPDDVLTGVRLDHVNARVTIGRTSEHLQRHRKATVLPDLLDGLFQINPFGKRLLFQERKQKRAPTPARTGVLRMLKLAHIVRVT